MFKESYDVSICFSTTHVLDWLDYVSVSEATPLLDSNTQMSVWMNDHSNAFIVIVKRHHAFPI